MLTVLVILHHLAVTYSLAGYWPYTETPSSEFAVLELSIFTVRAAVCFSLFRIQSASRMVRLLSLPIE